MNRSFSWDGILQTALAHHHAGRAREADALYAQILTANPKHADAWYLRGTLALQAGDIALAVERLRKAIKLDGAAANYHVNLGLAWQGAGDLKQAVACFRTAVRLDPKLVDGHANLAHALLAGGKLEEALASYRRALALEPHSARVHYNIGVVLRSLGQLADAARHFAEATARDPALIQAHANLGVTLQDLGDGAGAEMSYKRALAINAAEPESLNNYSSLCRDQGRFEQAFDLLNRAIAARPDFAEAYRNRGLLHLLLRQYPEGWRDYEWRWNCFDMAPTKRPFGFPRWTGDALSTGALLVWGEQGPGDEILYASMVRDVAARVPNLMWEADARLLPLLARTYPDVRFVARATPPQASLKESGIAQQSPAASLGQFFRPSADSFPKAPCYLRADEKRAQAYRAQLNLAPGERLVGISWISRNAAIGAHKSSDLSAWSDVLQTPGVRFVNLQYGDTTAERAGTNLLNIDGLDLRDDLDGLAALMTACDLVVTVSNTTAHLAGALGVPTWVLVPAGAGKLWYWGQAGDSTPWYPSITIMRQAVQGQWRDVFSRVAARLATVADTLHR